MVKHPGEGSEKKSHVNSVECFPVSEKKGKKTSGAFFRVRKRERP